MSSIGGNLGGRFSRRAAAITAVGGLFVGIGAWSFSTSPIASAEIQTHSASVDLLSLPAHHLLELSQFDASLGTLTQLTVTATLEGNIEATVWNLTNAATLTTVVFDSSARSVGPGGIDLNVAIDDSTAEVLEPAVPREFDLSDAGNQVSVVTDPAALALFLGTGNVVFDVTGLVDTNVFGPAAWRTRGVANALATVTIDYDFTTGPTTTSSSTSSTSSTTTTSIPATTSTTTTSIPTTTSTSTTTSTTSSTSTSTTTSTSTSTTTEPPPVCETVKVYQGDFQIEPGSYIGGRFTITEVNPGHTSFSWTSTDPVMWMTVDVINPSPHQFDFGPDGSFGASGVQAADGGYISYIWVNICG